ncbi:hypothetical protein [[Leptolyngbya] sp. PCC 7376]|uniref:hypothetical protein n=1 Tax=[Leptolyngbya] sp. PCC 7376 TaxID=111781 RepID=UPI00135C1853|nr:hypothetical protein [[Leptolyngbya] sp. PCC 7376]
MWIFKQQQCVIDYLHEMHLSFQGGRRNPQKLISIRRKLPLFIATLKTIGIYPT